MSVEIKYNYHDGWIERVTMGPRREAILDVGLDTVWNPGITSVLFRFGGIHNFEKTNKYFASVAAETSELDGRLRIDAIHLDHKKSSKSGDVFVFIQMERVGHMRIHCQNISETVNK